MRIFIDEAGPFVVPPSAQSLFSLVLALVIPSCVEGELFAEFSQLRDGWSSQGGEVKGSKLNESQAAQLIDRVSRYDVFVNFFATDMARNDDAIVSAYKARQADAITAGLTPEHNAKMTAQLRGLATARKLAVLLHHLWVSGEVYEPLHNSSRVTVAAAA